MEAVVKIVIRWFHQVPAMPRWWVFLPILSWLRNPDDHLRTASPLWPSLAVSVPFASRFCDSFLLQSSDSVGGDGVVPYAIHGSRSAASAFLYSSSDWRSQSQLQRAVGMYRSRSCQ